MEYWRGAGVILSCVSVLHIYVIRYDIYAIGIDTYLIIAALTPWMPNRLDLT